MYSYIIGNVTEINSNNIVLENNKIGYMIYVPNPFSYKVGEEYKVYTYNKISEDEQRKPFLYRYFLSITKN